MRLKLDISMQSVFWITLCILLVQPGSRALVTLDLNGQWMVANTNRSHVISGTVPGSMYTALMANNVIGDPYFRENDGAYRWIGRDNWEYSRTFKVESSLLQRESVVLVCEGLDTVATILINNQTVGTSDNMFVRYIFNIKDRLVLGLNGVKVKFTSAVSYSREAASAYPYTVVPSSISQLQHGENHVNMIRKEQCSFSWDWGPSFPTQGIWKDIYIQGYDTAAIRYVTAETLKNTDGSWRLNAEVFTEVMQGVTAGGTLELKLEGTSITRMVSVQFTSQISQKRFEIDIPKTTQIKEWWPNGHGNQTLYDLFVFYTDQHGMMTSQKVKVGFRTVEVVEDYVSVDKSKGKTFYFRINGRPVFFKGSNWIPADSFQERITRDYVYRLLKSAADVHMNVLRVWGGGVYESEDFYEIADELGIMIWQDFMFACAMYPTDTNFLQSVSKEVTHQVRRLKHHPSIVVLSGNNENEKALRQDWYGTNTNYTRYHTDYVQLYHDVIYKIVQQEDPNRIFLASSPSNGVKSGSEDWVAAEPWSTLYGDIHEYSYLVPFYDQSQYRIPRFSSEYGLQSYPSYETLKPVYHEDDMYYWGELNDWRNHHPFGNIELMAEAIQYVNLPNSPERLQKFKDQIYVTQITHAIGMKTETEHYRRWQNRLDDKGQGNTMGALYWMLADIWQAPTWASIEYGGKWKMLHYYAQHFFAPTLISPYLNGSDVIVYIVMDELPVKEDRLIGDHTLTFRPKSNPRPFNVFDWQSYYGTTFKGSEVRSIKENQNTDFAGNLFIDLYSWSSMTPLHSWKIPFKINSTAQSVYRENYNTMMSTAGCYRNEACFLYFHFGDLSGPTNWLPLSTFVSADGILPSDVKITRVTPTSTSDQFSVTITTSVISPFVWLEATGISGRFSDNGFLMVQPTMTLVYYAWETTSVQNLKESLKVMSLMDIYH